MRRDAEPRTEIPELDASTDVSGDLQCHVAQDTVDQPDVRSRRPDTGHMGQRAKYVSVRELERDQP